MGSGLNFESGAPYRALRSGMPWCELLCLSVNGEGNTSIVHISDLSPFRKNSSKGSELSDCGRDRDVPCRGLGLIIGGMQAVAQCSLLRMVLLLC